MAVGRGAVVTVGDRRRLGRGSDRRLPELSCRSSLPECSVPDPPSPELPVARRPFPDESPDPDPEPLECDSPEPPEPESSDPELPEPECSPELSESEPSEPEPLEPEPVASSSRGAEWSPDELPAAGACAAWSATGPPLVARL